jgi:hypothetical protein
LGLIAGAIMTAGLLGSPAAAQEFKSNFMLGVELRYFPDDAEWWGQDSRHLYPSIFGEADLSYNWGEKRNELNVVGFGRFDLFNDRRTHADLREANYRYRGTNWDLLIGAHRVFWGVTESRHLVNIINQVDLVEDVDGDEYLGQPMVNLGIHGDWGRLDFYAMTFFRERTFPSNDSRLRGPLPIRTKDAQFEAKWEEWNIDLAVRYQKSFGPVDLGLSAFHGTNREPALRPAFSFSHGLYLRPIYETMTQGGIDVAWAFGDLVLKAEALYRFNQGNPFFATVFGGEYTFKNVSGSGVDLGLLAEFNWDDRKSSWRNPGTIYNKDVFAGMRLTFNDAYDTNLLLGTLVDVDNHSTFISFEASRRVFTNWRAELEARFFAAGADLEIIRAVDSDSFVQLRLKRFF